MRLILIGGSRNSDDDELVDKLRRAACSGDTPVDVQQRIEFIVNAPFSKMEALMASSSIGLHTMWNEHFGISVVEMMAAGMVVVAHRSGGPMMDIVVPAAILNNGAIANIASRPGECRLSHICYLEL